jgi:hypothetical protein
VEENQNSLFCTFQWRVAISIARISITFHSITLFVIMRNYDLQLILKYVLLSSSTSQWTQEKFPNCFGTYTDPHRYVKRTMSVSQCEAYPLNTFLLHHYPLEYKGLGWSSTSIGTMAKIPKSIQIISKYLQISNSKTKSGSVSSNLTSFLGLLMTSTRPHKKRVKVPMGVHPGPPESSPCFWY